MYIHNLHLQTQTDQFHLGQLYWVDEACKARTFSSNTSYSVYVQVVAFRLCKLHLRKRYVEDVLATQSAGLHLDKDVISQIIPTKKQMQAQKAMAACPALLSSFEANYIKFVLETHNAWLCLCCLPLLLHNFGKYTAVCRYIIDALHQAIHKMQTCMVRSQYGPT